jgi:hypothetical protein
MSQTDIHAAFGPITIPAVSIVIERRHRLVRRQRHLAAPRRAALRQAKRC